MSVFEAIIQGIIQGLTEFLPVSSSGHLSIYQYFTGLSGDSGAFFSIALHVGTLLAVFLAFYRTILSLIAEFFLMLRDIIIGRFKLNMNPNRRMLLMLMLSLLPLVAVVFLKDFFESFSTDQDIVAEGLGLITTGLLLYFGERFGRGKKTARSMRSRDALAVGAMQALAPIPGVSRSGSTVSVGRMAGLDKQFAVTFSFIMGIPAVLGAALLEVPDIVEHGLSLPVHIVIIGVVTSALFGFFAIKMVKWLMAGDRFIIFSYYTLIAGVLVTAAGIYEHLSGQALQAFVTGLVR